MTDPTPVAGEPQTKAGRALLNACDSGGWITWDHQPVRLNGMRRSILAIEAEAQRLTVERLTDAEPRTAKRPTTMRAHNHGPEDGPGLSCREWPVGECMAPATFCCTPNLYWKGHAAACLHRLARPAAAEAASPAALDADEIEDILADAESDGIIGPEYTPRRLAQYIVDSLTAEQEEGSKGGGGA